MAVVAADTSPNAGFHYVLLVDPETFAVVAQFDVGASGGQYAYALADVPAGSFLLFAGSDADNDFSICGTGEACGAFPTLGSPEIVEVAGDRSNLDFVTGFLQTIESSAANADGPTRAGLRRLRTRRVAR
jgi:serine protease